jgi:hypothetical protein
MKIPRLNPYYLAALVLALVSMLQLIVAVVTDRRDLTSAALVISAAACLITAIFLAILSTSEPLDLRYVSRLPVQGSINLCRTCADLGIHGTGCFLPPVPGRQRVVQFIPVAAFEGTPPVTDSFVFGPEAAGLVTEPAGLALYYELRANQNLAIPSDLPSIVTLIRETATDVLEMADSATATINEDGVVLTLENFRLFDGCMAIHAESPLCCSTNPCPVGSLFAMFLAEGSKNVVVLSRCTPRPKDRSVVMVFSLLPGQDRKPEVEVPVTGIDPVQAADAYRGDRLVEEQ